MSLSGHPVAPGAAVGRLRALPSLEDLAGACDGAPAAQVEAALAELVSGLARTLRRLRKEIDPAQAEGLSVLALLLDDARLRSGIVEACRTRGVVRGLGEVIRSYALTPLRTGQDGEAGAWLAARAQDVEHLCLLLAAELSSRAAFEGGDALVVGGRVGALLALSAVGRSVAALVVAGSQDERSLSAALLRAGGVPAVADVAGLFDWARPGDTVLVDGSSGHVRVHPAPTHLARLRTAARA